MRPNTYDPDADTAYLVLSDATIVESEEVSANVVFDYDADNRVVGIEILNASKTMAPGGWKNWPQPGSETHAHAAE